MMVNFNEKELFALMVLVRASNKSNPDVTFEEGEGLELKLLEALLTETGHWPPTITQSQLLEAKRMLEDVTR